MFGSRIYDCNEDGDFDITKSTTLISQMSIRKSNSFTERRVFPYAREEHLLLNELMPLVRRKVLGRQPQHEWGEMTDMEIMLSAGLYEEDVVTGLTGFNLAAIMLFGRDEIIQQVSPGYVTDCLLRVRNLDRYDDRERVDCNLIQAFDKCMEFIRKHTIDPFYLDDNTLNVSVRDKIAKELVSNILVHREFSSSMPARIIIEKDKILGENWNRSLRPGKLDPENYDPNPKNPILARFFVQIGYADTLGSGVRNLFKYTQVYSGIVPELIEGDVFKTIIPLPRIGRGIEYETPNTDVYTDAIDGQNVGQNVGQNLKLSQVRLQILELMESNSFITAQEIAGSVNISKRRVESNISALRAAGLVRRIGSSKGGHWEVLE